MIQFVVRSQDGLTLCEFSSDNSKIPYEVRSKVNQLKKNTKTLEAEFQCLEINTSNDLNTNLSLCEGIIYMILNDKNYPLKLSKLYLDDIQSGFVEELKSYFGTQSVDYQSKIEILEESYKFQKFDRFIKRKIYEYQDVRSNSNIERLQNDLISLQNTMIENIDLILDREKSLKSMGFKATQLRESSKMFKDRSEKLKLSLLLKKYMIPLIILLVVILYLSMKFLF